LNLLSIKLDRPLTELESFLHKSSEFPDSTTLVSEDFLSMSSADDDFGSCGRDTDFAARVTLLSEFAGEEFVEFSKEDSVGDELDSSTLLFFRTGKERGFRADQVFCPSCVHRRPCERRLKQEVPDGGLITEPLTGNRAGRLPFSSWRWGRVET
jgi:hypothetical protein